MAAEVKGTQARRSGPLLQALGTNLRVYDASSRELGKPAEKRV